MPAAHPLPLHTMLQGRFLDEAWPDRFDGPVSGLSAGCGTGRGSVVICEIHKELKFDGRRLESTSLAFAATKAETFGIADITFGLADILELGALDHRTTSLKARAYCITWIRRRRDSKCYPAALLQTVSCALHYTAHAAAGAVAAARKWIAEEEIEDTVAGLREARVKLRALPVDHPARAVADTPEFFVLSGLHDLVFNVQEHRYTPKQLRSLLKDAGLRFLGFDHNDPSIPVLYADAFPDDPGQTNLDNWDSFEQNHPDTFAEMYQMWCRPA